MDLYLAYRQLSPIKPMFTSLVRIQLRKKIPVVSGIEASKRKILECFGAKKP